MSTGFTKKVKPFSNDIVSKQMRMLFKQYRKDPALIRRGNELTEKVIDVMDQIFASQPQQSIEDMPAEFEEVPDEMMDEVTVGDLLGEGDMMSLIDIPDEDEE
ncbi:MAG: hypothetical protein GWO08_01480 [Gammaproteobacteria bacterium]|nr:hypothetical protein [Gammaproteobacteria bacterium]